MRLGSPNLFLFSSFSHFVAPSLISELRAEKIEQKSITLVWREPSYPNSSRTEYEVKYYEKVNPLFSLIKTYIYRSPFFLYINISIGLENPVSFGFQLVSMVTPKSSSCFPSTLVHHVNLSAHNHDTQCMYIDDERFKYN